MTLEPKIEVIGAPFNPSNSSCGRVLARPFAKQSNVKLYVDHSILDGSGFGWVCESTPIISYVVKSLKEDKSLRKRYRIIFTHDYDLLSLDPVFQYAPNGSNVNVVNYSDCNKTKLVSAIASKKNSTTGHMLRHEILPYLLYSGVDIFGAIVNKHITNKNLAFDNYMFSVAIENECYNKYYTEKLVDCFATKTVPIYWGTQDISPYDERGVIRLSPHLKWDTIKLEEYCKMKPFIEKNFELSLCAKIADDIVQEHILSTI